MTINELHPLPMGLGYKIRTRPGRSVVQSDRLPRILDTIKRRMGLAVQCPAERQYWVSSIVFSIRQYFQYAPYRCFDIPA